MKINLYTIITDLENKLKESDILFKDGLPVVPKEMILKEIPEDIVPHPNHLKAKNQGKTLICNFSQDDLLYTTLKKLENRLAVWKNFMGICGFDFSARLGDEEVNQDLYLYLNKLLDAYVALHGIKILPNFRTAGTLKSLNALRIYPPNGYFAVGTLGCGGNEEYNSMLLHNKLVLARPSHLIIYGCLKNIYRRILEDFGVGYTVFEDYNNRSRKGNFK